MMFCLHWNTCPWSAHTRILTFLQHNNIMKGTHMPGGCSCHGDGLFGAQPRVGNRPLWMNPVFRKSLLMTSSLSEEKKERQHVGRRYAAVTHVTFHTRWCNESGQKGVKSEQERAEWWGWHFNQRMKDDEKAWAHRDWWRQRLSSSTQQPSPFTPELMLQKHKYSPKSQTHNDTKRPPNHSAAPWPQDYWPAVKGGNQCSLTRTLQLQEQWYGKALFKHNKVVTSLKNWRHCFDSVSKTEPINVVWKTSKPLSVWQSSKNDWWTQHVIILL